jgi:hypothetical protein
MGFGAPYDEGELFAGLAAEQWAATSRTDPRRDAAFYRDVLRHQGGRALEVGWVIVSVVLGCVMCKVDR